MYGDYNKIFYLNVNKSKSLRLYDDARNVYATFGNDEN